MRRKMAKKKVAPVRKAPPQLVVRISEDLDRNLRKAADGLELDLSGVVRMILSEHVAEYIRRGIKSRKAVQKALAEAATSQEEGDKAETSQSAWEPPQHGKRNLDI